MLPRALSARILPILQDNYAPDDLVLQSPFGGAFACLGFARGDGVECPLLTPNKTLGFFACSLVLSVKALSFCSLFRKRLD